MPGYVTFGNKYTDWSSININNKDFMFLKPRKMLLDLLVYKHEPIEWDMKTILIVGPQNSGKTVFIRYIVALIESIRRYSGSVVVVRTNDLRILSDHKYYHLFDRKGVIVLIIDDAIREGIDSRRAMSGMNVELTEQFCITRHVLEENYRPNGIIFLIFATQIYSRIDPTIRDTSQLKVFTAYYDLKWFENLFTPEQSELLRIATYEGMFSSNFDARRFALFKTNTGEAGTMEVPLSRKEDVPIKYIDRRLTSEEVIEQLVQLLLDEIDDFSQYSSGEVSGFLIENSKEIEAEFSVKIKTSEFKKAVDIAKWRRKRQLIDIESSEIMSGTKTSDGMSNLERIEDCVRTRKIASVSSVAEFLKMDKSLVSAYLSGHKETFERVTKGHYCIKGENYSINDVYNLTNKKQKEVTKKLEM